MSEAMRSPVVDQRLADLNGQQQGDDKRDGGVAQHEEIGCQRQQGGDEGFDPQAEAETGDDQGSRQQGERHVRRVQGGGIGARERILKDRVEGERAERQECAEHAEDEQALWDAAG